MNPSTSTSAASELLFAAGFLPTTKPGQWAKADLRIIERHYPCCTGIVTPEPAGIPDRHPGGFEYGTFPSFDLLRGNSRITGSTEIAEVLAAAAALAPA